MLQTLQSMYDNIKTRVKGQGLNLSNYFDCILGVRQGESLSPFLFSIYINDVQQYLINYDGNGSVGATIGLLKVYVTLYADDAAIICESREGLEEALVYLENYCKSGVCNQMYSRPRLLSLTGEITLGHQYLCMQVRN